MLGDLPIRREFCSLPHCTYPSSVGNEVLEYDCGQHAHRLSIGLICDFLSESCQKFPLHLYYYCLSLPGSRHGTSLCLPRPASSQQNLPPSKHTASLTGNLCVGKQLLQLTVELHYLFLFLAYIN